MYKSKKKNSKRSHGNTGWMAYSSQHVSTLNTNKFMNEKSIIGTLMTALKGTMKSKKALKTD
jgi:hypothetical protein